MVKKYLSLISLLFLPFLVAATLTITNGGGGNSLSVQNTRSAMLMFDGTDDHVDTGDAFESTLQGSFSISLWIKPEDGQPGSSKYIYGSYDVAVDNLIQLYINVNGRIGLEYISGGNLASALSAVFFTDGPQLQTHIMIVGDATIVGAEGLKIYLNNTKNGVGNTAGVIFGDFTISHNLYLGARNQFGSDNSNIACQLSDIRIFNRALSSEEVTQIYRGQTITSGLVARYPMQEGGLSGKAYDVSGNNNHGTLTNFTLSDGWANVQNFNHYNQKMGYESYTDDGTGLIEIRVPYKVDGTLITPTIAAYTKQSNNPGREYNHSQIEVTN